METIGDYEYSSANRLGLGAFAIVFKGRSRKVNVITNIKALNYRYSILFNLNTEN